ncbi:MAG: multiheme c-type cytochrome [Desulfobacterales bacterium]|nr:multiheme c-type cytochrome [Desulfobacterales bacterium]
MARKPHTCKECHVGPDVPAFKVYSASKHGNIYDSLQADWDFKAVPWTVGRDFSAPTCATCHISLLVNTDGELIAQRTHQMSDRLSWRIFGLIYAHPHPRDPDTTKIRNRDGQPLPTDFAGGLAAEYLISSAEQATRAATMQAACLACHSSAWVAGHRERFENTIRTTNRSTLTATTIMTEIWSRGFAAKDNPFDEAVEQKWTDIWLFHANNTRFASAMAGGGDGPRRRPPQRPDPRAGRVAGASAQTGGSACQDPVGTAQRPRDQRVVSDAPSCPQAARRSRPRGRRRQKKTPSSASQWQKRSTCAGGGAANPDAASPL